MDSKGSDRPVPVPLPVELEEKKKRATDPHFGNRYKSCTISTRLSGSLARRVGSGDLGIFFAPSKRCTPDVFQFASFHFGSTRISER